MPSLALAAGVTSEHGSRVFMSTALGLLTGAVPAEVPVVGVPLAWFPAEGVPDSVEEHPVRTAASTNGTTSRRMPVKVSDRRARSVAIGVSRVTHKAQDRKS